MQITFLFLRGDTPSLNLKTKTLNGMTRFELSSLRSVIFSVVATKRRGVGKIWKVSPAPLPFVGFSLFLSLSSAKIQYSAQTSTRTASYAGYDLSCFSFRAPFHDCLWKW